MNRVFVRPAALEGVVEDPIQRPEVVDDRLWRVSLFLFGVDERFEHRPVDLFERCGAEEGGEVDAQVAFVVDQGRLLEAQ